MKVIPLHDPIRDMVRVRPQRPPARPPAATLRPGIHLGLPVRRAFPTGSASLVGVLAETRRAAERGVWPEAGRRVDVRARASPPFPTTGMRTAP